VVVRFSWLVGGFLGLLALAAGVGWLVWMAHRPASAGEMAGYITDAAVVEREYAAAHGRLLADAEVRQLFQRATELARKRQYRDSVALLEATSKKAAVPVVFNNLGVLYALLGDRSRMLNAFREALARNSNYEPVHRNLERLRGITEDEARPVTREIEPNNTKPDANVIAVGTAVEGEIDGEISDVDTFKFPSPPAPRDILALEVANRSKELILDWNLYDDDGNLIGRMREQKEAGAPVRFTWSPPPNTTFYLSIWSYNRTSGAYVVTVKALKAFDAYEPNDDIFKAHPIPLGQTIEANIMDGQDQDFYSFTADRAGTVNIDLENLSATLVPGLTTFGPDKRTLGFAPDAHGSGASLHYSIAVEANQTYYVQVWPVLEHSSGNYKLRLELH